MNHSLAKILLLTVFFFGMGIPFSSSVYAGKCGGTNQRPCTLWERIPSCNKGLVENFRTNRCVRPRPKPKPAPKKIVCGAQNQRPCKLWERVPSCNKGLVEDFSKNRCVAKKQPPPKVDLGKKFQCGKKNQKPCKLWERIPSCDKGLVEHFPSNRCVSNAELSKKFQCGKRNQRPCKLWERLPSCTKGLVEHFPSNRCVSQAHLGKKFQCGRRNQKPCKIWERIPSCDKDLVENFLTNRCEVPKQVDVFQQLSALAKLQRKQGEALIKEGEQLVKELSAANNTAKTIRDHLAAKRWDKAVQSLKRLSSFRRLENLARQDGKRSLTVGAMVDAQFLIGANVEVGVAIDLTGSQPVKGFTTLGLSAGIALGADGGVNVGIWEDSNDEIFGDAQGIVYASNAVAGMNHGFWVGYPPKGQCCLGEYKGLTVGISAGLGAEIGEYNRVSTILF